MMDISALCCTALLVGSLFDAGDLIPAEVSYPGYAVTEQTQTVSGNDITVQVLVPSVDPAPVYVTTSSNDVDLSALEAQLQEQMLTSSANSAALLGEIQAMAASQEQAAGEYLASVSSGNASLLAELRAISTGQEQAAENYLSATIVDVMDRVVRAHPFCKYIGFRTSLNNATDGTLVYGNRSASSSGSVTIYDGYKVDYYRYQYQSGYQTYYEYRYTVTPVEEYTVNFGTNTLVYTNVVPGYPTLGVDYTGCLVVGFVFLAFLVVLLRRH
ncbi:MAG: hypothetical protein NC305_04005 [Lachnospiraceae bacterium]|nr:hypothetical protein [Muribaculaceae bacterium]MCM1409695.1 hypothetical protein [Lachnospiraceae bacterium]